MWLTVAKKLAGLIPSVEKAITDKDEANRLRAGMYQAALEANALWGPQGIAAVIWAVGFLAWLSGVTWLGALFGVFIPWSWLYFSAWFGVMGILFGIPLDLVAKFLEKMLKLEEKSKTQ